MPSGKRLSALLLIALLGCSKEEEGAARPPSASEGARGEATGQLIEPTDLRVVPPPGGAVPAGVPVAFRALLPTPISPTAECEWNFGETIRTVRGPDVEHAFSAPGRVVVRVRTGGKVSWPVEMIVFRVSVVDALERPLRECRLAAPGADAFDPQGRLRDGAVPVAPERIRILVEDPALDAPSTVEVSTGSASGAPLNPAVTYPLTGPPERRLTRPILLLGDSFDDASEAEGIFDNAAGDPTLHAVPSGRLLFRYRGNPAGSAEVGPMVVHEIPVRFFAVGAGLPPESELRRAVDLRLAQANLTWEPFGRRFVFGSISRLEAPRHLLIIRGRSAGTDPSGRPSRAGARVDGRELAVLSPWRDDAGVITAASSARSLVKAAGEDWTVDLFEKMFTGDPEAVVLRFHRRDGTPAVLERLTGGEDISQNAAPLEADLSNGCEVAPDQRFLTLEEIALLAGVRRSPSLGMDIFLVSELRSLKARSAFKVYPSRSFPASLSGAAVVSWKVADGSGRYPYAMARVLGELLIPPDVRVGDGDTLFREPLSPLPGPTANKRVTGATGLKISERGRGSGSEK